MKYNKLDFATEERKEKIHEYKSWNHNFAVAVYNISKEYNIGSLLRTAHCAKAKEFFLIGENSYNTYASGSSHKWTTINYFKDLSGFMDFIKTTSYNLILIEQSKDSIPLFEYSFPENPLFLLGAEKGGLPKEITDKNYPIVEIPQYGLVKSLNLSCSGSIVIYHYLYWCFQRKKVNLRVQSRKL